MAPVIDNSRETAWRPEPVHAPPAKQVADECEPKVYDHPLPLSVYDDMATCG